MLDESKAIKAKEIVDNPDDVFALNRSHIMISDQSVGATFSNMVDAINILYEFGWEVVTSTYSANNFMFVVMKNTNYKRKNFS
jgi:excinuclease UvrABC ATPase subunit